MIESWFECKTEQELLEKYGRRGGGDRELIDVWGNGDLIENWKMKMKIWVHLSRERSILLW